MTIISKGHHKPKGVYPPKLGEPFSIFVICASIDVARMLAKEVVEGRIASIYGDAKQCLAAYKAYPMGLSSRYAPFAVDIDEQGFIIRVRGII